MLALAEIVLPPIVLDSILLIGVLMVIVGALYLAYDLLGRQHGPLQWLTLLITCGLISTLVLGVVAPTIRFFFVYSFDLAFTFQAMLIGGVMGVFTATLIDFPRSQAKPSLVSWRGIGIGLGLGLLLFFVTFFLLGSSLMSSLVMGLTWATLASLWPSLIWNPSASKPQVFSRKGLGMGLLLGLLFWFVFFFMASRDVVVALLASVPFAVVCGVLISLWHFIHWEVSSPQPQVFSRKGLLVGFTWFRVAPPVDNSYKWAGGGFLSTAEDLVKFGSALLQPGFLKAQTLDLLFTSQRTTAGEPTGYGIGWFLATDSLGHRWVFHGGSAVGGTAAFGVDRDSRVVVAILSNLSGAPLEPGAAIHELFDRRTAP